MRLAVLFLVTILLSGSFRAPALASERVVRIDPAIEFQTIRGWEATARSWEIDKKGNRADPSWMTAGPDLAEVLVNEVGLNSIRLEAYSGLENPVDYWARFSAGEIGYEEMKRRFYDVVNDNGDARGADLSGFSFTALDQHMEHVVLPLSERLTARGEALYVTLTFVDFNWTDGTSNLDLSDNPEEYAEFITVVFDHLDTKYGLRPDALELVLEPDNTNWNGTEIGRAILSVTERLAESGYTPTLIGPSLSRSFRTLRNLDAIRAEGAMVDVLAYHRYDNGYPKQLKRIAQAAKRYGVDTAMLEWTRGSVDHLFQDLTVANVVAWQKYGTARKIVDGKPMASASYYVDAVAENGGFRYVLPPRTRLLAEVFRTVRAGAVRIHAQSSSPDISALAVRRPEGGIAAVFRVRSAGAITVQGMPPGRYQVAGTAQDGTALAPDEVEILDDVPLTLPSVPDGVITLIPQP